MELTVDSKIKDSLQKQIAKSKKSVCVIAAISKFLLVAGLIGGSLYLIINFISPTLSMAEVRGELVKDTSFIIITSSFIFAPCLIFSACLNVLAKNLAGGNSSARVDESLFLMQNQLRYSFRIKHQSAPSERCVITIYLSNVEAIDYDNRMGAIAFTGEVICDYYDDYKKKKPVETDRIENFVIYDYFTPSLRDSLSNMGIHINNN